MATARRLFGYLQVDPRRASHDAVDVDRSVAEGLAHFFEIVHRDLRRVETQIGDLLEPRAARADRRNTQEIRIEVAVGVRSRELGAGQRGGFTGPAQIDEHEVATLANVVKGAAIEARVEGRRIAGAALEHEEWVGLLVRFQCRQHDDRQIDLASLPGVAVFPHFVGAASRLACHAFDCAGRECDLRRERRGG